MQIVSITTNLTRYGGAQKVLLDLHNGLKSKFDCKIVGFQDFDQLHPKYGIKKPEYEKLSYSSLQNKIIIVHARNVIPIIVALNTFLFLKSKIVYVSHNVYSTHKYFTFFPKTIVSISNKVTENLINYFGVKSDRINLIYNGIEDKYPLNHTHIYKQDGILKILYPARVNSVKRQLQIVNVLKDQLNEQVQIHFAGTGDDLDELHKICSSSKNFKALGFVENLESKLLNYDYVMLYSTQEGLPLSLLEGIMCKKPLITNNVGGNWEIGVPGFNGVGLNEDWNMLAQQVNDLLDVDENQYKLMSDRSRNLFLQKFKLEKMIENYSDLIKSL